MTAIFSVAASSEEGVERFATIFNSASSTWSLLAKIASRHVSRTGGDFLLGTETEDLPLDGMPRSFTGSASQFGEKKEEMGD